MKIGPESEVIMDGKEILEEANKNWLRLKEEAAYALIQENPDERYQKLVEATQVIADLPERVKGIIPEELFRHVLTLSAMAKRAIEGKNDFAMGVLLWDRGSRKGDPTVLEKIIKRI